MVNTYCFSLLADRGKVSWRTVMFFCSLMAHYDLRRFRSVDLKLSRPMFDLEPSGVEYHLHALVRAGILEMGTVKVHTPLYRLALECRLDMDQLEDWTQETAERRQRLEIAPPADPRDIPGWLMGIERPVKQ